MKKELIIKIAVTLVSLIIVLLVGVFLLKGSVSKTKGIVTIEVVDINNQIVISDNINFKEGDTLVQLLKDNYELRIDDSYGFTFIYDINEVKTGHDDFLAIYVNNEKSMVGVDQIELVDGSVISFRVTLIDYDYEE